jgi:hypothetical protein
MRVFIAVTAIPFHRKSESPTARPTGTPKRAAKTVAPAETDRDVLAASTTSGENDPIMRRAAAKEETRKSTPRPRFQFADAIMRRYPGSRPKP